MIESRTHLVCLVCLQDHSYKQAGELKCGCRQMGVLQVSDSGVTGSIAISQITGVWGVAYDRGHYLF